MSTLPKDLRPVLRAGSLAYYDSFIGPVPCKVIRITGKSGAAGSGHDVTFKITASRGAYKRGEILTSWGLHVVPRAAMYSRRHGARIGYYTVEVST